MRNIFLEIEYLGTRYFGFQIQNKGHDREPSVQAVLEQALQRLFGCPVRVNYSSRTDRGVHAKAQGISFNVDTQIPLANIKRALNSFLPPDIRVKKAKRVGDDFHARFSARSKVYRYTILNKKEGSVFSRDYAWHIRSRLDSSAMQQASRQLIGDKDFSLFAKDASSYKSCRRHLQAISIRRRGPFIYIDIAADGFLRSMARNIVYFLVAVGAGKISPSQAAKIIQGKLSYQSRPAPAQGLCLIKTNYV